MKYVVSGSRRLKDYVVVEQAIESAIQEFGEWPSVIIEGGQRTYAKDKKIVGGADYFAKVWAMKNQVPFRTENAKWGKYNYAAGPIRNRKMAELGDVLVAVPDEASKGTRDMINAMHELRKPIHVVEV